MTKATDNRGCFDAMNAAERAGIAAREKGRGDGAAMNYKTDAERAAFRKGWHESMRSFHAARAEHYNTEMLDAVQREGGEKLHEEFAAERAAGIRPARAAS